MFPSPEGLGWFSEKASPPTSVPETWVGVGNGSAVEGLVET
jgi:hypothetical protein